MNAIYYTSAGNVIEERAEFGGLVKFTRIGRRFDRRDLDALEPRADYEWLSISRDSVLAYEHNGAFRRAVRLIGGCICDEEDFLNSRGD